MENQTSVNYKSTIGTYKNTTQQYAQQIASLQNRNSIMLSLFWILYAVVITGVGFVRRSAYLRIGGLLLLLVAGLKLFFYDLWSLGTLYRIISATTLGIVLLLTSYVYNRYKDRLSELIVS